MEKHIEHVELMNRLKEKSQKAWKDLKVDEISDKKTKDALNMLAKKLGLKE